MQSHKNKARTNDLCYKFIHHMLDRAKPSRNPTEQDEVDPKETLQQIEKRLSNTFNPRFGCSFSNPKNLQLHDLPGGTQLFKMLHFAINRTDRALFVKFRSGQISLDQFVA